VISPLIPASDMISVGIGDVSFWPCFQQGKCCHDRPHSFSFIQYSLSIQLFVNRNKFTPTIQTTIQIQKRNVHRTGLLVANLSTRRLIWILGYFKWDH
jgi:hypothetical protein